MESTDLNMMLRFFGLKGCRDSEHLFVQNSCFEESLSNFLVDSLSFEMKALAYFVQNHQVKKWTQIKFANDLSKELSIKKSEAENVLNLLLESCWLGTNIKNQNKYSDEVLLIAGERLILESANFEKENDI